MFVTSGAAFQFVSPACEAMTDTTPAPVNDRFVPPLIAAGPLPTAKLTGKPDVAVAARPIRLVVSWSPNAGKLIVWSAFATTSSTTTSCGLLVASSAVTRLVAQCVPALSPVMSTTLVSRVAAPSATVPCAGRTVSQPAAVEP